MTTSPFRMPAATPAEPVDSQQEREPAGVEDADLRALVHHIDAALRDRARVDAIWIAALQQHIAARHRAPHR